MALHTPPTHTHANLSKNPSYSCKVQQGKVVPVHTCQTRLLLGAEHAPRCNCVSNDRLEFPFQKTPNHFKGGKYGPDIPYYKIMGRSGWSTTCLSAYGQGKSKRNLFFPPDGGRKNMARGARFMTCCRREGTGQSPYRQKSRATR